jgi:hypothetical protein
MTKIFRIDAAPQLGCTSTEVHPVRSASPATRKQSKREAGHPNLYVPLRTFGCLEAFLEGGHCCRQLQTVSEAALNTQMFQTITNGCSRLQNAECANFIVPSRPRHFLIK